MSTRPMLQPCLLESLVTREIYASPFLQEITSGVSYGNSPVSGQASGETQV